jgi:hypothetical protein
VLRVLLMTATAITERTKTYVAVLTRTHEKENTTMSGPIYRETVYDGDNPTRAVFVYLPTTVTAAGYVNQELIAGAVEHPRPAHESYKGASFWHIVTVLDIPGVDHDQLKALETNDETVARAWLGFLAGLAEMAVDSGQYALRALPPRQVVAS